MKRDNMIRLWVEILMLIAMLALMDITTLGYFMHERIGLALGLFVLAHLIIDRQQITILLRKICKPDTPRRMRLGYIVDVLLLIAMLILLGTGLSLSTTLFADGTQLSDRQFALILHNAAANWSMVLLAAHLWLHKSWIKAMAIALKRLWQKDGGKRQIAPWLTTMAIIIIAVIIAVTNFSQMDSAQGHRWQGGSDSQQQIGDEIFTLETLAHYDGKDGRPSYVAVDGLVYDVSGYFIQGQHHQGAHAGMDLTGLVTKRKCLTALTHCTIVGVMESQIDTD